MKVALGYQGNLKSNFTSNRMCIVQTCLECYGQCHSSAFYQLISGASFMPWQRQPIECSSFIQLNDGMRTTVTFAIWWMLLWNSKHLHVRIPTEICEIVLFLSLSLLLKLEPTRSIHPFNHIISKTKPMIRKQQSQKSTDELLIPKMCIRTEHRYMCVRLQVE